MPVNTYVIESWVGDAVEELNKLFTFEYVNDGHTCEQYVNGFLFHLAISTHLDVGHVSASTARSPAFDDGFSVNDVTLPAVVR